MARSKSPRSKSGMIWQNNWTTQSLGKINLPEKLKCGLCKKHKMQSNFSGKQLGQMRLAIEKNGEAAAATHEILCTTCKSGHLKFEMTCTMCDKTKGMDEFTKVHHKNPDEAKCIPCMKKRTEMKTSKEIEAEHKSLEDEYISDDDDNEDDKTQDGSSNYYDTSSVTDSLSSLSVSSNKSTINGYSTVNSTGGESGGVRIMAFEDFVSNDPHAQRNWTHISPSNANPSSANSTYGSGFASTREQSSSGYYSNGTRGGNYYGAPVARPAPSVADSVDSASTTGTETGSRARFPRVPSANRPQSATEDNDSDDNEWKTDVRSASKDDDSEDEHGPNFYG